MNLRVLRLGLRRDAFPRTSQCPFGRLSGFCVVTVWLLSSREPIGEIEPHPLPALEAFANAEHIRLLREPTESVSTTLFTELRSNDILFIDSSHILKLGSDVWHLYLEILRRLGPGVLIHVHDIEFPFPCSNPEEWIFKRHQFWNESALLKALLCWNFHMEIVLCSSVLAHMQKDELKAAFPVYCPEAHRPASICIRTL